jgi:hypothetical protein
MRGRGISGNGTCVHPTGTLVCSTVGFPPSDGGRMAKTDGVCAEKGKKKREGAGTPNPRTKEIPHLTDEFTTRVV